jgi:hypothetical protein
MFEDSQYRAWANEGSNLPPGFKEENERFDNLDHETQEEEKEHYSQFYEEGEF